MLVRLLLFACDVALSAALLVATTIAATGGTRVAVGRATISLRSVGNLLIAAAALAVVRYAFRERLPFLANGRWRLDHIGPRATRWLAGSVSRLAALPPGRALSIVAGVALAGAVIKLANAILHPGFFSGDDVEIHEMSLGVALGQRWPIWELRSAFYPMTVIYPLQALLVKVGIVDPAALVLAGRLVVTAISSAGLILLFRWSRRVYGDAVAVLAVCLLGTSILHIQFGGSELPRSVSAVFVVAAFFCVRERGGTGRMVVAGLCIAVAAGMRFSEVVFFAPALLQLLIERRGRDAAALLVTGAVAAVAIQGVSDAAYWHSPFYSARQMLQFTLVDRLSSRGYEPPWFYVAHVTAWTDLLTFALAVASLRSRDWRLALWLWVPIAALSVLPHKEPRYLIPSLPFLCLAAACALVSVAGQLRSLHDVRWRDGLATALVAGLGLRLIFVVASYRVGRTDVEVALAREIGQERGVRGVALEHSWRFGGHLYLRGMTSVEDLGPDTVRTEEQLRAFLSQQPADVVAISDATCERLACASTLSSAGFRETSNDTARQARYRTFERN